MRSFDRTATEMDPLTTNIVAHGTRIPGLLVLDTTQVSDERAVAIVGGQGEVRRPPTG